ncbi:MAG TPA: hypothetical protein VK147_02425 [Candidatus Didemnitutus sp.]|jgi:hypothetical protein|nr:hypothetical protein [Candidatus Didemnitutus sp.]
MNIAMIKGLVEATTPDELRTAEEALLNEQTPLISVPGVDEGEQLTHVLAALYVHEQKANGTDTMTAIRDYAKRVRASIS